MTDEWLRLLGEVGWETPTEDLTWCTTEKDDVSMSININAKLTRRTEATSGFRVLGTVVTFDNNFDVEVENRLARATRAFWASWEMLGCAGVPFFTRAPTDIPCDSRGLDVLVRGILEFALRAAPAEQGRSVSYD